MPDRSWRCGPFHATGEAPPKGAVALVPSPQRVPRNTLSCTSHLLHSSAASNKFNGFTSRGTGRHPDKQGKTHCSAGWLQSVCGSGLENFAKVQFEKFSFQYGEALTAP
ncbi:hypothetical protein Zmor_008166 [Zophobas morio]|uniref:Uncharacterized protein n=1 Tax=Zophobas morio TaxID=2755281 RepID=A0AA38MQF0_9CUCU|nr:hypothetical protein Zmor_008166 [Zophobas morio]